jgi:hypothetical protein
VAAPPVVTGFALIRPDRQIDAIRTVRGFIGRKTTHCRKSKFAFLFNGNRLHGFPMKVLLAFFRSL